VTRTWRARAVTGTAAAILVAGLGVSALPGVAAARPSVVKPAAAAKPSQIEFLPAVQSLRSTSHTTLHARLSAAWEEGVAETSLSVTLTRKGTPEIHSWLFELKNGALAFSPSTGKGSLKAGTQLMPYGKVSLTLTAIGNKHVVTCGTFKTVTQPVRARGVLSFNTHSTGKHRWGTVGGSVRTFGGTNVVSYELGAFQSCSGPFEVPCTSLISWQASTHGAGVNSVSIGGTISTFKGRTRREVFANRTVSLKKPKNASRTDSLEVADQHMAFSESKGKASVRIGASGLLTGSASLISPSTALPPVSFSCGNVAKTQHETSWRVPYKNGKSPLAAHEQIEGSIRLPNISLASQQATVTRETVS
jgi:hypothetical protein